MLRRDTEQRLCLFQHRFLNPTHFTGPTKVFLTFKIHSPGLIRWSGVARPPKTNRGLRSRISDGPVPRTHRWSHTVGRTVGGNTSHKFIFLIFFDDFKTAISRLKKTTKKRCQHVVISADPCLSMMSGHVHPVGT